MLLSSLDTFAPQKRKAPQVAKRIKTANPLKGNMWLINSVGFSIRRNLEGFIPPLGIDLFSIWRYEMSILGFLLIMRILIEIPSDDGVESLREMIDNVKMLSFLAAAASVGGSWATSQQHILIFKNIFFWLIVGKVSFWGYWHS